jgi:hypothetical protein
MILETINVCCKIPSHISTTWKGVEYHLSLFQKLSVEVSAIIQNTANNTRANSPQEPPTDMHYPPDERSSLTPTITFTGKRISPTSTSLISAGCHDVGPIVTNIAC